MGGAGASLADGFAILGVAGRYALPVPLAETLLAGWLLARAGIAAPAGAMTVAPARPRDRITLECRRHVERTRAAEFPSPRIAEHIAVVAAGDKAATIALVKTADCRVSEGQNLAGDASDSVTFERVESRSRSAPAPFRCIRADADGRDRAQRADRRRAGGDPVAQRRLRQRARRLRAPDRKIPGRAAEPRAARRRNRGRARRRRLGRRHHRASRRLRRHGVARSGLGENPHRRSRRGRRGHRASGASAPSASPTSTCCIASRCACWRGATISAAKAIGRRRSAE